MLANDIDVFANARQRVQVAGGEGAYANTRRALAAFDLSGVLGMRVLLKPNIGRVAAPGSGVVTHVDVVAAAMDAFAEAGAEVSVGDSPITGVTTAEALDASGIAAAAAQRACRVLDLDARAPVAVEIPDGEVIRKLSVCADVLEHDLIVSIPVMKMHMHTGVTLSVKNMKGCLYRRTKVELHMLPQSERDEKPLDIAIADMASVLRPHFAIVDGTVGMEGLGPSAGEARALDVVLAGVDGFAADAVACRLMGTSAACVPHLRMGAERGLGTVDLDRLLVAPPAWEDLAQDFAPAPDNLSIEFPNVTVRDRNSCSACQSTLLLLLRDHNREVFDYIPEGQPVRFAIGKGHDELPPNTICLGNCTRKHRGTGVFVPGCPPVGSAILQALKKRRDDRE
jgi:uncharacterized protein (DUF362 family)